MLFGFKLNNEYKITRLKNASGRQLQECIQSRDMEQWASQIRMVSDLSPDEFYKDYPGSPLEINTWLDAADEVYGAAENLLLINGSRIEVYTGWQRRPDFTNPFGTWITNKEFYPCRLIGSFDVKKWSLKETNQLIYQAKVHDLLVQNIYVDPGNDYRNTVRIFWKEEYDLNDPLAKKAVETIREKLKASGFKDDYFEKGMALYTDKPEEILDQLGRESRVLEIARLLFKLPENHRIHISNNAWKKYRESGYVSPLYDTTPSGLYSFEKDSPLLTAGEKEAWQKTPLPYPQDAPMQVKELDGLEDVSFQPAMPKHGPIIGFIHGEMIPVNNFFGRGYALDAGNDLYPGWFSYVDMEETILKYNDCLGFKPLMPFLPEGPARFEAAAAQIIEQNRPSA